MYPFNFVININAENKFFITKISETFGDLCIKNTEEAEIFSYISKMGGFTVMQKMAEENIADIIESINNYKTLLPTPGYTIYIDTANFIIGGSSGNPLLLYCEKLMNNILYFIPDGIYSDRFLFIKNEIAAILVNFSKVCQLMPPLAADLYILNDIEKCLVTEDLIDVFYKSIFGKSSVGIHESLLLQKKSAELLMLINEKKKMDVIKMYNVKFPIYWPISVILL